MLKFPGMKPVVFTLGFFVLMLICSCTKVKGATSGVDCSKVNATYSVSIQPIIATQCAISGCHVASGGNNIPYLTYADIKAKAENGSLKDRVITKREMPPTGPLTNDEMTKIQCWLNDGAPDN